MFLSVVSFKVVSLLVTFGSCPSAALLDMMCFAEIVMYVSSFY